MFITTNKRDNPQYSANLCFFSANLHQMVVQLVETSLSLSTNREGGREVEVSQPMCFVGYNIYSGFYFKRGPVYLEFMLQKDDGSVQIQPYEILQVKSKKQNKKIIEILTFAHLIFFNHSYL